MTETKMFVCGAGSTFFFSAGEHERRAQMFEQLVDHDRGRKVLIIAPIASGVGDEQMIPRRGVFVT